MQKVAIGASILLHSLVIVLLMNVQSTPKIIKPIVQQETQFIMNVDSFSINNKQSAQIQAPKVQLKSVNASGNMQKNNLLDVSNKTKPIINKQTPQKIVKAPALAQNSKTKPLTYQTENIVKVQTAKIKASNASIIQVKNANIIKINQKNQIPKIEEKNKINAKKNDINTSKNSNLTKQNKSVSAGNSGNSGNSVNADQLRAAQLARLQGYAQDSPQTSNTSKTPINQSNLSGLSEAYKNRVKQLIKQQISYSGALDVDTVMVMIKVNEQGAIIYSKLINSSGDSRWDNAVLTAIKRVNLPSPPASVTIRLYFKPTN